MAKMSSPVNGKDSSFWHLPANASKSAPSNKKSLTNAATFSTEHVIGTQTPDLSVKLFSRTNLPLKFKREKNK